MSSRKGDTPPPAIPQEIKEDPFADWRVHGFDRSIHDGITAISKRGIWGKNKQFPNFYLSKFSISQ